MMKSGIENMQNRPELSPVAEDYVKRNQQRFKDDQRRINIFWNEAQNTGEIYGVQSSQYLEKVLAVLREELLYFSFVAGVYHSGGANGYYPKTDVIDQLNSRIQELSVKIGSVADRLETVTNGSQVPGAETAA